VANSEPAARRFVEMGFPAARVFRAPHGTRIEPFWRVAEDRAVRANGPLRLLSVGRLIPRKGCEWLVRAVGQAQRDGADVHLTMVGTGSDESRLRALADKLGIAAAWRGFVDQPDLPPLYGEADAFAFPTLDDPFGMVLLEAAASGLPLIVPDRGGVTSYTTELNAYPAPPAAEAFTQAILRACHDVEQRVGKIRAARETAELYSWPKVTDSFLSLYETIYQAGSNRHTLNAASPAFVSTPPKPGQARLLHVTSKLAQLGFSIYEFTGRLLRRFQGETRRMCETEMEAM